MLGRHATYIPWLLAGSLCLACSPAFAAEPRARPRVPSPAQTAALALSMQGAEDLPAAPSEAEQSSWLESPWFWAGVVGVVATGVVVALVVANSNEDEGPPKGNLGVSISVLSRAP